MSHRNLTLGSNGLRVLEDEERITKAQERLIARLSEAATRRGRIEPGFQGGSLEAEGGWIDSHDLWFASRKVRNRHWNGFGRGDPFSPKNPSITVEINPPLRGIYRRTAGLFVEDEESGEVLVGHRGRIAGGGRKKFLVS